MQFIESSLQLRELITKKKQQGLSIGFVPTMGNLHEGHLQLIDIANQHADFIVCSIFVNPTQFGEGEDFENYPRTLESDQEKLQQRNCDVLFYPKVNDMYPDGTDKNLLATVRVPGVSEGLCGGSRPGHFDGVATVVSKLFNIVQPDSAVFGEKDFQQLAVIRKLTQDLNFPIEIISAPIVREQNGLAMSSRNGYLSEDEKEQAGFLYKLLCETRNQILESQTQLDYRELEESARKQINQQGFNCDYFEIRKADTLHPATGEERFVVILIAAFMGNTRLIDNLCFSRS